MKPTPAKIQDHSAAAYLSQVQEFANPKETTEAKGATARTKLFQNDEVSRNAEARLPKQRRKPAIKELASRAEKLDLSGLQSEDLPLFGRYRTEFDHLKTLMQETTGTKSALMCQGGGVHALDGVVGVFLGARGVGKETAAKVLAQELGRDLYRLDQAQTMDMGDGELLKHLRDTIQSAAKVSGHKVLLMIDDLSDMVEGRSEVFKNELGHLLERQTGMVLLSSEGRDIVYDLVDSIDAQVQFPGSLDPKAQRHLWEQGLGDVAPDLDITPLIVNYSRWMKEFQIESVIKNVQSIAERTGAPITNELVNQEVRREASKVGQLV